MGTSAFSSSAFLPTNLSSSFRPYRDIVLGFHWRGMDCFSFLDFI